MKQFITITRLLKRKRDAEKLTQKELAAYFNIPQPRVSEYLSFLLLTEKDQTRLEEGELTWKQARSLSKTRKRIGKQKKQVKQTTSSTPFITVNGVKLSLAQALILTTDDLVVIALKRDGGTLTPTEAARALKAKHLAQRLIPFAPIQAADTVEPTVNDDGDPVGPHVLADNREERSA